MVIRRLSTRISLFFALLAVVIAAAGFTVINAFIVKNAERQLSHELVVSERVFRRIVSTKQEQLAQAAAVLAADFAFREAVATNDRDTLRSALANHGARISAGLMMMIDLAGRVVATTASEAIGGQAFPYPELLARARADGQTAGVVVADEKLYQMVLVPVRAPVIIGWIAMGFVVDDALARDVSALTGAQVTFLVRGKDTNWRQLATTLAGPAQRLLALQLPDLLAPAKRAQADPTVDANNLRLVSNLNGDQARPAVAVLERCLDEALEPYESLRSFLAALAASGLLVAIVGGIGVARGITSPLHKLADVARLIAAGDYSRSADIVQADEVGALAVAFNQMQEGIAARESTIMDLAYRDPLTSLPNRALFNDRLQQALAAIHRAGGAASVLMVDLDDFRYVNNTLGHQLGDLVLKEVAIRLQTILLRKSDTLARLGADEFAILLPAEDLEGARRTAMRVLESLEAPLDLAGHRIDVAGSIGIVSAPEHGEDVATLMSRVDLSMSVAKRAKTGFAEYAASYDQSPERLSLLSELRSAVEHDELVLFYQPKIELASGRATHVEALVRWQHPVRGFVPPDEFIPFAEQTGYIRTVTQWVLDTALKQVVAWRSTGISLNMCINVSARDLLNAELPEYLAYLLKKHDADPATIWLEITESAIMDDPLRAQNVLERLDQMGLHLSIDDFGTGYSSLAYLKRLPVDELKIDKTFVLGMNKDPDDAIIVRSTIELGHNMSLKIVAEGVDNEESLNMLKNWGCDIAQGFYISRPLPADKLVAWLHDSTARFTPENQAKQRAFG